MATQMSVDVDAVNERLNGLVTLLKAVGVDSLAGGGTAGSNSTSSKGGGGGSGIPDARQLDDDQIKAIIKKLQMAQSEAPQLIAALEAQAKMKKQQQYQERRPPPPQQQQQQQHVDGDDDDDDDNDDANYPMVGYGCSDDISVMSDLTTPTVVQGSSVPDEEHYRDTLPPMIVGGGSIPSMLIAPTKRKNLVGAVSSTVRSNTLAAPRNSNIRATTTNKGSSGGGAAAQRRKHYNATMEKLAYEPQQTQQQPQPVRKVVKTPAMAPNNATPVKTKVTKTPRRASVSNAPTAAVTEWDSAARSQWNAFENTTTIKTKKTQPTTLIDDDGFLMGTDASFDPFQAARNPFKSGGNGGFTSNNSSMGSDGSPSKQQPVRRKKTSPAPPPNNNRMHCSLEGGFKAPTNFTDTEEQHRHQPRSKTANMTTSSSNGSAGSKPRRSRRASLAM